MVNKRLDEKAIFDVARKIESPEVRLQYLQQICGNDDLLRERVVALARIHDQQGSLLETSAPHVSATVDVAPPVELPGTQIGPYKLLEQIGEGGMGVVYHASQREPVRRTVALKIIKPGMDTREVVKRFEAERQALAMMDHPNIAKVFDGGATDAGRPYFVMELIKRGKPITEYCDREQLSMRERLELFVTLCHGVQHAHQKGVIHRDLKPSNVLVEVHDVRPVAKIIDFGIAKAMGQQLSEQSLHTALDQMVGTPLYMSPEQAGQSAVDVDTRSDIYSLGVVLYELLTGHTPFEKDTLRTAGVDEMRRIIREVEPPRPSARVSTLQAADLSTISERRHIEPRKLSQQLRGDLDWIVMKAMDKDRDRRYASVSALATDVQRYLNDEPVQARPPSLAHHAAKWVRRHRALVWSTIAVLAIATLAGGVLYGTSYRRTAQLQRDAGEHLAAATAFVGSGNYTAADRELADVRGRLESAGYREGPLQENVTDLTTAIAAKTEAISDFSQFQNLRQRIHSEMYAVDRDILDQAQAHCRAALDLFGVFETESWRSQAAFELLDTGQQKMLDEGAVELLFIWARLEMGKSDAQSTNERTAGYRRAIEVLRKIEKSHASIRAVALWVADCWEALGEQQAAAEARARAESLRPASATDYYLLGEYHAQHGQQDEALASYWQALAQQPDHYLSLLAAGVALGELRKYESAETMLTGAIAMNPQTIIAYLRRATARQGQSKMVLAQADIEEAKKRDPELARVLLRRAGEHLANFLLDKASADYSEAIRLDPQAVGYAGRGVTYLFQGDLDKALADCDERIRLEPGSASAYYLRADVYRLKGDMDKALADANEGIRLDPNYAGSYLVRGRIYGYRRELDKALDDLNEAIRLVPQEAGFQVGRADIYLQLGEREKALADYEEAIRLDPKNVWGHMGRATVYQAKGELDKALADRDEAVRIAPQYALAYAGRATLYRDRGDFEKALADYNEAVRLAPQNAQHYLDRAAFLKERGDLEKALADCNEAVRLAPQNAAAYVVRAGFHKDREDFDKALADYNEVIRLAPQDAWPYAARAAIHNLMGDRDKALADYTESIRLAPQDHTIWRERANIHRDKTDFEKALADYTESLRVHPHDSWTYVLRAQVFLAQGDLERAIADYCEAIRIEPERGSWYGERGNFFLDRGDFEKAAADYDRAAELPPISWHFYKLRALAHFQLKHYDKALESIAKAVELKPDDFSNLWWIPPALVATCPDERLRQGLLELADKTIEKTTGQAGAYAARGLLRLAFGHQEEAFPDFRKAVELKSEDGLIWYQCAFGQLAAGRVDDYRQDCGAMLEQFSQTDRANNAYYVAWSCALAPDAVTDWATAVALAEKAVQSEPKSVTYLNTLGAVLYRAGRFDEALTRLSEAGALVQVPSEATLFPPAYIWFFLAMTQQRLGHAEEAKQWLDKAAAWTDKILADADQGTADLSWNRRLTLKLVRDEAAALLGVTPPAVEPAPAAKVEETNELPKTAPATEPPKEEEKPQ